MLVNVIVELALMPAGTMSETGSADIRKSGGGPDDIIVKTTVTVCDVLPKVPVTLTIHLPIGVDEIVEKMRVDEFVPPA